MSPSFPPHELDSLAFTIEEADECAAAGDRCGGADLFSGAIYRLEQEAAAGHAWAPALREQYWEELAKYYKRQSQ